MKEIFRRLRYLLNRRRYERELADDMEVHREMAGLAGNQNFGNGLRLREESRDAWGWTWIDHTGQDLRYAFRVMRKSPGFTVAALLTIAIGIRVNVAAFGFFNLTMLRPMPVREPDTLLRFHRQAHRNYASDVPYPAMAFYREHTRTLTSVFALEYGQLTLEGAGKPIKTHFVTANFFSELGAATAFGRTFDPAREEDKAADLVAVLGYEFWRRQFGGNPAVVGQPIRLSDKQVTVIGVAASGFCGLGMEAPDLWAPIAQQPNLVPGSRLLTDWSADSDGVDMWGRLRTGVSPTVAEAEMRSLAAELRKQRPNDIWENEILSTEPGGYLQQVGGRNRGNSPPESLRATMYPIFGLVGALSFLILAVACGNLGSLLLARGVARQREIALRVAVGAGSGRLIRQLLTESLLLALLGSAAGLGLGCWLLKTMLVWTGAPVWLDITPDWRVVAFTIGSGFAAAIFFGLTPALQIARQRHQATFMRQLLIGSQVAGSCVLLIVAGLLVRALHRAVSAHPGFEYQQVVAIEPGLEAHGYSASNAAAYLDGLKGRLRNLSGIQAVSLAATPPLGNRISVATADVEGRTYSIYINPVEPEFFQTMTIPLLRGRNLKAGDTNVLIVSESLARRRWPGEDPVGKTFSMSGAKFEVVGVAGSARTLALKDGEAVEIYRLISGAELAMAAVLVKTSGPPEGLMPFLASIARAIDPKVVPEMKMLKSTYRRKFEDTERSALAASLLGLAALLLACLGIVGLVTYAVSQRTKEIGIRMAIGAKPSHVLMVVLQRFMRPVVWGLVVGIAGAAGLSQVLRHELYGVSGFDPLSYAAAIGVFVITAALAALLPATRALRVDPIRALRHE